MDRMIIFLTSTVLLFSLFTCLNAAQLKISENGRNLEYLTGEPFFYLGDTAWELFHRLDREAAEQYLKNRAEKGFTVIQAVALAELDGLNTPNPYGDKPLINNDPVKPNEKYFGHVDYIVNKAAELGLLIGLLPTWGDKFHLARWGTGPEIFTPENAEIFGAWIANRYKDQPIIWILGGDRPPADEEDRQIIEAMARGIRKSDKTNLISYHPWGGTIASDFFQEATWLDFDFYQSGHHQRLDPLYLIGFNEKSLSRTPKRPVINGEPNYEDHPVNWLSNGEQSWFDDFDCRFAAYVSLLSGACGHTYGNHNIWQMWEPGRTPSSFARTRWQRALDYPGAFQMGYLRRLFESLPWEKLVTGTTKILNSAPQSFQVVRYSEDHRFLLAYTADGSPISPDLKIMNAAQVNAFWFNPRDGERHLIGRFETNQAQIFTPHSRGRGSDWLLLVTDVSAPFPVSQNYEQEWNLLSPDGAILLKFGQQSGNDARLTYSVELKSGAGYLPVIEPSALGIQREDQTFIENLEFQRFNRNSISEQYSAVAGKRKENVITANESVFHFTNPQGAAIHFIFRVQNDGVAFRYHFPEKNGKIFRVVKEITAFHLPGAGKAWILPYDTLGVWSPAYEAVYEKEIPVGTPAPASTGWGFPALFEVRNRWILLTESGLDETYCGSHLAAHAENGRYQIEFPLETESYGLGSRFPQSTLPWSTPWRVILTGSKLATIVESNLVQNLAAPCAIKDVSWIKPGKSSWSWWSDHASARDFNKLKAYIDLAAEMKWDYSLVDAEWDFMVGGTLEELAQYAASKKVGLFVWYNSGGPHNKAKAVYRIIDEIADNFRAAKLFSVAETQKLRPVVNQYYFDDIPFLQEIEKNIGRKLSDGDRQIILEKTFAPNATPRDRMHLKEIRRREFAKLRKMGVKGVKVDFFNSDKQDIIKLYLDLAKDAADFKLLLNTHGCTIPRGWQRTWPNFISMEGVRGAECYGIESYSAQAVWLNTIYPFTRNVPGPMDYTPVTFSDVSPETPHLTTNAHELALSVIFECGIQHFADRRESYAAQPDFVRQFLSDVPVTWDETVFIDGYPGKYIILARRKGGTWYLAGINGEMQSKKVSFKLPFTPRDGQTIHLITDDTQPRRWKQVPFEIPGSGVISLEMLPAGGFVGVVTDADH